MEKYKLVLEEWDDKVGKYWKPAEETFLNPVTFLWID
jgi:hypothetical protein